MHGYFVGGVADPFCYDVVGLRLRFLHLRLLPLSRWVMFIYIFKKCAGFARRASRLSVAVVDFRFHPNHVPIPCLAWQGVCCRENNSCALPPIEHMQNDISTISSWLRIQLWVLAWMIASFRKSPSNQCLFYAVLTPLLNVKILLFL